jgi:hypothetical protein
VWTPPGRSAPVSVEARIHERPSNMNNRESVPTHPRSSLSHRERPGQPGATSHSTGVFFAGQPGTAPRRRSTRKSYPRRMFCQAPGGELFKIIVGELGSETGRQNWIGRLRSENSWFDSCSQGIRPVLHQAAKEKHHLDGRHLWRIPEMVPETVPATVHIPGFHELLQGGD